SRSRKSRRKPSAPASPCSATAPRHRTTPFFLPLTIAAFPRPWEVPRKPFTRAYATTRCAFAHTLPHNSRFAHVRPLARSYNECTVHRGKYAMHLLLVDGHPIALETLGSVAKGSFAGACVDSASGLDEACRKARSAPPVDLVVLDPRLPGCSGLDALVRMRAEFPALRVLVVSGDEDGDRVLAAMDAGAAGYALKTF